MSVTTNDEGVILSMTHREFDHVVSAYKAVPTPSRLQALLRLAIYLEPEPTWRHIRGKEAFTMPFGEIRAVCDWILTAEEMQRFSGCLGYALKATLAGEELSAPYMCYPVADGRIFFTVLEFGYASLSSTRTTPDFFQAFATARQYIFEGTPVRTSDREGKGTKDTRLVEGIDICNLSLYVR